MVVKELNNNLYDMENHKKSLLYNLLNDSLDLKKPTCVYKIFWILNSKPVCINRLFGTDQNGLLYIGKSIEFNKRLGDIKSSIKDQNHKHHFGIKYNKLDIISSLIRKEDLYISYYEHDSPRDEEEMLLIKYFKIYGELPPFNSNF